MLVEIAGILSEGIQKHSVRRSRPPDCFASSGQISMPICDTCGTQSTLWILNHRAAAGAEHARGRRPPPIAARFPIAPLWRTRLWWYLLLWVTS